jgi:spermidine/putrescine-binding protein
MIKKFLLSAVATAALLVPGQAMAAGELNIFNWGNYTNPELIKKFEEKYDAKVTVTDYDSNDTALAKVKAGGHGYDIVVPSASYVPIWIKEGLLIETRPDQMENFKNVADEWRDPSWDPGRKYTVPWQWGSVGITVDTSVYKGDINTSAVIFDPPEELVGKINVAPEMGDVMGVALYYVGSEPCTTDKEALKKGPRRAGRRQAQVEIDGLWHHREVCRQGPRGRAVLERGCLPLAAQEPGRALWLPQGRLSSVDGLRGGPEGRQERRQRKAVPELHHGA